MHTLIRFESVATTQWHSLEHCNKHVRRQSQSKHEILFFRLCVHFIIQSRRHGLCFFIQSEKSTSPKDRCKSFSGHVERYMYAVETYGRSMHSSISSERSGGVLRWWLHATSWKKECLERTSLSGYRREVRHAGRHHIKHDDESNWPWFQILFLVSKLALETITYGY